jgi:ribosome-binding factor A
MEQTPRQRKIASLLQQDIAEVITEILRNRGVSDLLITITEVQVTVDLAFAKAYISIFPTNKAGSVIEELKEMTPAIKHAVALRVRHQLRRMPELSLYLDDTMDRVDGINRELKEGSNPIKDRNLLDKRKKL